MFNPEKYIQKEFDKPSADAIEICKNGDFFDMISRLKERGLLKQEIERIKSSKDCECIKDADFLAESDWEILAIIELYDINTFKHSISTYLIAKEKIEKVLQSGEQISNMIEDEGVYLGTFYRSCLMHDVGKVSIPKVILNNHINADNCEDIFLDLPPEVQNEISPELASEKFETKDSLTDYLDEHDIRLAKILPLKYMMSDEELKELKESDPSGRFSVDMTLGEAMKIHESESKRILMEAGKNKEAVLAGSHHNYERKKYDEMDYPSAFSSLYISNKISTTILRLADIESALRQKRSYKKDVGKINTLFQLVMDSREGILEPKITALWVKDELSSIVSANDMDNQGYTGKATKIINMLIEIKDFIKSEIGG